MLPTELTSPSPAMESSAQPVLPLGAKRTLQDCSQTGNAPKRPFTGGAGEDEEEFLTRFPALQQSGKYLVSRLSSIVAESVQKASGVHPMVYKATCKHPIVHKFSCLACQGIAHDLHGPKLDYLEPGLMVSSEEAGKLRCGITRNLLESRKLHLILDLDNTLLHSINYSRLIPEERHLKDLTEPHTSTGSRGDFFLDEQDNMRVIKLRPFVRSFLKEASEMFELTVYTKGGRSYANRMVDLLDPGRCYFGNRVIARQDLTDPRTKSLDVVLAEPFCTLILDDSLVWPTHSENQIMAYRYNYFTVKLTNGRNLPPKEPGHVEDDRNYLENILYVLKSLHGRYFSLFDNGEEADIRILLSERGEEVLKDCHILFTGSGTDPAVEIAEELGAVLHSTNCPSVTHVVSKDPDHDSSRWALEQNKFLVRPRWIFDAYLLWRRLPEHEYSLKSAK